MLGAKKKPEAKVQKSWRVDAELVDYVVKRGEISGETLMLEDCIRLHRTLSDVLKGHSARLAEYAADNALTMRDHESAVIARLVLAGLDAYEHGKKR